MNKIDRRSAESGAQERARNFVFAYLQLQEAIAAAVVVEDKTTGRNLLSYASPNRQRDVLGAMAIANVAAFDLSASIGLDFSKNFYAMVSFANSQLATLLERVDITDAAQPEAN